MLQMDAPAGSEARAISSMDAIRSDASTSLRGRTGGCPFFPFGILCSGGLHQDIIRAFADWRSVLRVRKQLPAGQLL